ncbi:DMT family transporter [Gordoniibacillus kamchatkensis]|uniref:DMT family transporter n=1 Tax=Gordoniibacillus kamchatkensis TaxID=1590651 RepID=UPI001E5432C0|nr:multidrug efflux SMR transporter [Paenibacillus sp. VKM B-2647]
MRNAAPEKGMSNWLLLMASCVLEVLWVIGLKASYGFTRGVPSILTVIGILASFWLFAKTLQRFSVSTGYALFTGIGTVGTTVAGVLWLGEPMSWSRLVFLALLLFGIIGLKATAERAEDADSGGVEHSRTASSATKGVER